MRVFSYDVSNFYARYYDEKITNASGKASDVSRALREVFRRLSAEEFTRGKYQSLSPKLLGVLSLFNPSMSIGDINESAYKNYVLYLKSTLKNDVSINSYLRDFITTMHFAMNEGYIPRFKMQAIKLDKSHIETYNESLINTSIFDTTKSNLLAVSVTTGNKAVDDYFKGNISLINNLLMALAEEQIKSAFLQSEKVVTDLHTRISQGIRESKRNGKKIGLEKGTILVTHKSIQCKEIIKKHAKDFGGTLSDSEVIKLCNVSRNSYYKYKKELKL